MLEANSRNDPNQAPASSDRSFGLVFAGVFAVIGCWPLLDGGTPLWWGFALSLAFGLIAFARPRLLNPLNRIWYRFGMLLHRVTSPIVLGLVFFAVLTPTGILIRLVKKDPLNLKNGEAGTTFWNVPGERIKSPESLRNQF